MEPVVDFQPIQIKTQHEPDLYYADQTDTIKNTEEIYDETEVIQHNSSDDNIQCDACHKMFTTKSSLKRHHERNAICKKWISMEIARPINYNMHNMSIVDFIENIKNKITVKKRKDEIIQCNQCYASFSNIGNLNKHYKTSVVCNNMAYVDFEKEIKKFII